MNADVTQFGVGGIIVYFTIKEMFAYLAKRNKSDAEASRKPSNGAGERTVEFWELKFRNIIDKSLDDSFKARHEELREIVEEAIKDALR